MKPNLNNFINERVCNLSKWCSHCENKSRPGVTLFMCGFHKKPLQYNLETNSIIAIDSCDEFNGVNFPSQEQTNMLEINTAALAKEACVMAITSEVFGDPYEICKSILNSAGLSTLKKKYYLNNAHWWLFENQSSYSFNINKPKYPKDYEITQQDLDRPKINMDLLKKETAEVLTSLSNGDYATCLMAIEQLTRDDSTDLDFILKAIGDLRGDLSSIFYRVDQVKRDNN